jgi:hypothetical protein
LGGKWYVLCAKRYAIRKPIKTNAKEIFIKSKYKPKSNVKKNTSEIKFLIELDENRVPEN